MNRPIISRIEAIEQNLKHYFTGEPCHRGHISERRVDNGGCMECRREDGQKRRKKFTPRPESTSHDRVLTQEEIGRITCLEDIVRIEGYDPDEYEIVTGRVGAWEQNSRDEGLTTLFSVRTNIQRKPQSIERDAAEVLAAVLSRHTPPPPVELPSPTNFSEPVVSVLAIMDAHVGMLAWNDEVGENYDSQIAYRDYMNAAKQGLAIARDKYESERILYILGNDLLHVDSPGENNTGGRTTRGTPQDVDTRFQRIFSIVGDLAIQTIEMARMISPVDVICVPGNHDTHRLSILGQGIAWRYHGDDRVNVVHGPQRRFCYTYGKNALLLTHGEEVKRKRDNLVMIFADEFPKEWASAKHREILVGHFHGTQSGGYYPDYELSESRGTRTRVLPALTSSDAWHRHEGYRHTRASTVLTYRKSGGVSGLHELYPA